MHFDAPSRFRKVWMISIQKKNKMCIWKRPNKLTLTNYELLFIHLPTFVSSYKSEPWALKSLGFFFTFHLNSSCVIPNTSYLHRKRKFQTIAWVSYVHNFTRLFCRSRKGPWKSSAMKTGGRKNPRSPLENLHFLILKRWKCLAWLMALSCSGYWPLYKGKKWTNFMHRTIQRNCL